MGLGLTRAGKVTPGKGGGPFSFSGGIHFLLFSRFPLIFIAMFRGKLGDKRPCLSQRKGDPVWDVHFLFHFQLWPASAAADDDTHF